MSSREARHNKPEKDLRDTHKLNGQNTEPRSEQPHDLRQLFSLELVDCPRLERKQEYALACRIRSAWAALITALKTQHDHMAALLGERYLPASYDALSEPEVLRLLHQLQACVDRGAQQEAGASLSSLQTWLVQTKADLERFRNHRNEMVRRNLRFVVMLAGRYQNRGLGLLDL